MSKLSNHTPDSWEPNYRLGGACAIKHGFAFKGESMTTDASGDAPIVVNIVNFQYTGGFRFGDTKTQRYLGTYPLEYKLQPGDVLLVMTCQTPQGEILGVPGRIPSDGRVYLHNQRMGLVVLKDSSKLDLSFLYYLFISQDFNQHLFKTSTGAKILHTAPSRIEDFRFTRPPFQTQQQIASILSAYDDLIENNTRRIKILEQMAQMLYREWFVNLRFPGHEKVRMVESEMGLIPQDWSVRKVEDIVGRIPSGKKFDQKTVAPTGSVPVFDQGKTGIIGYHNEAPGVEASRTNPIIVFANHTCYQRLVMFPFSAIQNVLPFRSSSAFQRNIYWLHWATKDLITFSDYKGHWPEFMSKILVVPPPHICSEFGGTIEPIVTMVYNLERRNVNLRTTRDLLLPKLVSGEVSVESVETEALAETV